MKIAVLTESAGAERRVATTPDAAKRFVSLGAEICIQAGAGVASRFLDDAYVEAGAKIIDSAAEVAKGADIVLTVGRPSPSGLDGVGKGALIIGVMDPHGHKDELAALAKKGVTVFAMELMPRITRAQVMDVLSSQANLAGYQAVIDAAEIYDRALPMMMTAAGTVAAAKAFVMGAGVAGLQAIATAKRLGAAVSATDVRPAAKEQVESLGAKFIAVEDEEFKAAETSGGYAKAMSEEYRAKQAELIAGHIAKQDIVITTALIPGRAAPKLVSREMLKAMRSGSIVVDLAIERGGNVEGAVAGEVAVVDGVTIIGHLNVTSRIPATASALFARNLFAFAETLIDKESGEVAVDFEDELVKATLLTRDGALVHPMFADG